MISRPETTAGMRAPRLTHGYVAVLFLLTLSGFGQMPVFKRYYVADIPGFGWLAKFYVTHYIHYMGAIALAAILAYLVTRYLLETRSRIRITPSGYARAVMLGGILVSGGILVFRNLDGVWLPPGLIVSLDLVHLGLVMAFLPTALFCLVSGRPWTRSRLKR